jgi:hypothetical protein
LIAALQIRNLQFENLLMQAGNRRLRKLLRRTNSGVQQQTAILTANGWNPSQISQRYPLINVLDMKLQARCQRLPLRKRSPLPQQRLRGVNATLIEAGAIGSTQSR